MTPTPIAQRLADALRRLQNMCIALSMRRPVRDMAETYAEVADVLDAYDTALAQSGGEGEPADRFAAVLMEAKRVAPFRQGGESSDYINGWNSVLEFIARAYEDRKYPLRAPDTAPKGDITRGQVETWRIDNLGRVRGYQIMLALLAERDTLLAENARNVKDTQKWKWLCEDGHGGDGRVYAVVRLNDADKYPDDINGWELDAIADAAIDAAKRGGE